MVTEPTETKPQADYSLGRVAELASREAVQYAFTRVANDIENLGYALSDVCECLCGLCPEDFSHSERYGKRLPWNDVYKTRWAIPEQPTDALYIKLRMDRDLLIIELCSFHRHRDL